MRWLMALSILLILVLSVFPLPLEWRAWRPEFMALIVVYWATYSPQYFGVFSAWVCGLLLDIVELAPLGFNSLGLVVAAYISHLVYQRIRSYALWQQAGWVFVLVGMYQLFSNWASGFLGRDIETPEFLVSALITAFLWPVTVIVIRTIKRCYRLP